MSAREKLLRRDRERLLQQIRKVQEERARFAAIEPGTSASKVANRLGKSNMTAPCNGAAQCRYYDASGRRYFVCFDELDKVVCRGSAKVFR